MRRRSLDMNVWYLYYGRRGGFEFRSDLRKVGVCKDCFGVEEEEVGYCENIRRV